MSADRVVAAAPFAPNVRAFTTLRHGAGASAAPFDRFNLGNFRAPDGDDPAAVMRNRAELVARYGLPSWPHWLRQVHGTRVVRFEVAALPPPEPVRPVAARLALGSPARQGRASGSASPPAGGGGSSPGAAAGSPPSHASTRLQDMLPPPRAGEGEGGGLQIADEPEADAAVTSTPGVVLAILTADCLPVVFAADDGTELAAAHAGWPGLSAGMLEATLAAMHTPVAGITAWIGPCAGPARYEVGRNVYEAFVAPDAGAAAAFTPTREGHWLADLPALARRRLVAAGLRAEAIHGGGLCTMAEPDRFFSHRRDGRTGRIATIAWLEPPAR